MKNSVRGSVDPFIVMDVMEAASKIEKAGRDVIHLEVGQVLCLSKHLTQSLD